jgi:glycosyltransferase involved in cell wall biosynthesis
MKNATDQFKENYSEVISDYPLVTVGIPTYNGGAKIREAVTSVLNQGYPNLEIIISDNCSGDNTMEICLELSAKHQFVRYVRQPINIGWIANFQFVLTHATGDFFMWLCDDDALEPGIVQRYAQFLLQHPDYSLVSGEIKYWIGDRPVFCERDFNIEQRFAGMRLIQFYSKVVYGSIFYGLMRKETAQKIPLKSAMGVDWHFVASVAYLGKIKNLHRIGYHKKFGGISKSFKEYAKTIGASAFAGRFPHLQIAIDAFSNILHHSPVYLHHWFLVRTLLAMSAFLTVLINFYGKQYPFIVGGRIKRWIRSVARPMDTGGQLIKQLVLITLIY